MIEITYGFVKPDGYKNKHEIKSMILNSNLDIIAEKDPYIYTEEKAMKHYTELQGKPWFERAYKSIVGSPTAHYIMYGDNAIKRLVEITGATDPKKALPNTIRARFGTEMPFNAFHRSDSPTAVFDELYNVFTEDEIPDYVIEILEQYK